MAPQVDLTDLQNAVSGYLSTHNIFIAAGPVAAAGFIRAFISKSKLATKAVVVSGAWLAVQSISTPALQLMQQQFGYLQSLFGG